MNDKFDSPRERAGSLAASGRPGFLSRGELANGPAQAVTRRGALEEFGVGLAGLALASLGLASKAEAGNAKQCLRTCLKDCKDLPPDQYQFCYGTCLAHCSQGGYWP